MSTGRWLPYALALRQPWQTARGTWQERQGRWYCQDGADGRQGWGDDAPWPEFGISPAAATAYAEECALLDLSAQRAGVPLNRLLSGGPAVTAIAVNAVFSDIFRVDREQLAACARAGFRVVKLKVGQRAVGDEVARLHQLAGHLPAGLRWRLDANGAWQAEHARQFIIAVNGLPIDGLEDPLASADLDRLGELQALAQFPIAVDDAVDRLTADFLAQRPVDRVVIKPARLGLLASRDLAWACRAAGIEVIVSSALDSPCGLLAAAHLAAAVAPEAIHGLATGLHFVDQATFPPFNDGQLQLPDTPGLGWQGPIVG